jgi:hypothetical protein
MPFLMAQHMTTTKGVQYGRKAYYDGIPKGRLRKVYDTYDGKKMV